MKERIESLNDWYGRLDDLTEDLEEMGLEVLEANLEYIVVAAEEDGEDVQFQIYLGGTPRTITIAAVEEVYRG